MFMPMSSPRTRVRSGTVWASCWLGLVDTRDAEAKPHSEGCREHIGQATKSDDVGQQRLHAAEQRLAPAGGQLASATSVEVRRRARMRR